jgi:hypothetical protein
MIDMVSDQNLRQRNRRVGLIIAALLMLLYLIAIVGVLVLN